MKYVNQIKCITMDFKFLIVLVVTFCLLICVKTEKDDRTQRKSTVQPHVIVIIADDLGWNDVSWQGSNQIPTPNIDALAYNGVILNRHYVLPICTPSRTAYLTGRYPIRDGMQGYPLSAGEPRGIPLTTTLLPQHLRRLGYVSRLVGKWHVGYYTDDHTPSHRGFDSFFGYYSGYVDYFNHTITQNSKKKKKKKQDHTGYDIHRDDPATLGVEYTYEYLTDVITSEAEDIIENHNVKTPLYLQVAHLAAHATGNDEELEVRNTTELNVTFEYIKDFNRRKYAGVITALDESVGRIVAALNNAGMLKNSVILFMSDNGAQTEGLLQNYGSNYPLRGLKFTLYEGGVRGAACIYSPLIKKSSRISNELIHITDWLPTFYSLAGGKVSDLGLVDGVDQWSRLSEAEESPRHSLLLNIDEVVNLAGAVIERYKLIKGPADLYSDYYGDSGNDESYPTYNTTRVLLSQAGLAIASLSKTVLTSSKISELRANVRVTCENFTNFANCSERCLFDLAADPCETTDVSEKHPEIVRILERMIDTYRAQLMNQTNTDVDPASYPENFDGVWMPWIKDTYNTSNVWGSDVLNFMAFLTVVVKLISLWQW